MTKTLVKIGAKTYNTEDYDIPTTKTFRDAWEANESKGVISVDMELAKDIWRDKIRHARLEEFAALDADFIRKLETGADVSDIVKRKQELRDATDDPRIEAAKTPEALMKVQPAGLEVI